MRLPKLRRRAAAPTAPLDPTAGSTLARLVAFVTPYVDIGAGLVASWLVLHVHIFGSLGLNHDAVASAIAWVGITSLTAIVGYLAKDRWLQGHIAWFTTILNLLPTGAIDHLLPTHLQAPDKQLGQAAVTPRKRPSSTRS